MILFWNFKPHSILIWRCNCQKFMLILIKHFLLRRQDCAWAFFKIHGFPAERLQRDLMEFFARMELIIWSHVSDTMLSKLGFVESILHTPESQLQTLQGNWVRIPCLPTYKFSLSPPPSLLHCKIYIDNFWRKMELSLFIFIHSMNSAEQFVAQTFLDD